MKPKQHKLSDKYNLSRITCMLIGLASVFSYSSLFAGGDYFKQEAGNYNPYLMFYIVLCLNIFNFLGILTVIPLSRYVSIALRTNILFGVMGVILLLIPIFQIESALFSQQSGAIIIYIVASFGGYVTGTMCTTTCAFSQLLPNHIYIQDVIVGQSISNIIGCILRFITKIFFTATQGDVIYFVTASVINFIAIIFFNINNRTEFIKYHCNFNGNALERKCVNENTPIIVKMNDYNTIANKLEVEVVGQSVVSKLRYIMLSIGVTSMVTFIVFPSFVQDIDSEYAILNNGDWMVLLVTTIFSVSTFVGRKYFHSLIVFGNNLEGKQLFILSAMQSVYIPIFIAFYLQWIVNDILLYFVLTSFGISTGYITTLAFIKYPSLLKQEQSQQQIGAAIIQFAMVSCLTIGSFIAIGLIQII